MMPIDLSAAAKCYDFAGQDVNWLLKHWAHHKPNHPMMIWHPHEGTGQTWSYGQFNQYVEELAAGLLAQGVSCGDKILIHCENCPEAVFSWYACARVGAVAVTTNTHSSDSDISYFSSHVGVVGAITQPQFATRIAEHASDIKWLFVTEDDSGQISGNVSLPPQAKPFASLALAGKPVPILPPDPTLPVGIQFTSGTTSRPKAVVHTHANMLWGARSGSNNLYMKPDDVYLVFLPFYHVNAQAWSIWSVLWAGGTFVLQPRFSASRFWDVSLAYRCTRASMIPFCFKAIWGQAVPEHHYRSWSLGIIMPQIDEHFRVPGFACWGMTETIIHGTRSDLFQVSPPMNIGRPSPGYGLAIVSPDSGKLCQPEEPGQLFVHGTRGVQLFQEYYRNPEANARSFDDNGWFDTGDVVRLGEDGYIYFCDRDKDLLKVGGENVSAREVEEVCMSAGNIDEVAVVARNHEMLDEVPVAFVIQAPGAPEQQDHRQSIVECCEKTLASFKQPVDIYFVPSMPRSTLEKVAKNVLRDIVNRDSDETEIIRQIEKT